MTATNHVVMGALIATAVHSPWLAVPLAFASHFALDSLPHFDYPQKAPGVFDLEFFSWLAADSGVAASILLALFLLHPTGAILMIACGVTAASPDLMWIYYQLINFKNADKWPWFAKFHAKVQARTSTKFWPVELAWFLVTGGLLAARLH